MNTTTVVVKADPGNPNSARAPEARADNCPDRPLAQISTAALGAVFTTTAVFEILLVDGFTRADLLSSILCGLMLTLILICRPRSEYFRDIKLLLGGALIVGSIQILSGYPSSGLLAELAAFSPAANTDRIHRCRTAVEVLCLIEGAPRRVRAGELKFGCRGMIASNSDTGEIAGSVVVSAPDLPWRPLSSSVAGDLVRLKGALSPVVCGDRSNPNRFEYSAYLMRRGQLGQVKVRKDSQIEVETRRLPQAESRFFNRLISELPLERREAIGVLLAAVIGNKDLLSEEAAEAFRRTGTSHLLVVSGFHVGFVFLLARWLFAALVSQSPRLLVRTPVEPIAVIAALGVVALYCCMLGGDQTVVRSAIVVGFFGLSRAIGRRPESGPLLLFSLIIVIAVWPESFFEAGFQLTAAACFALIFSGRCLARIWSRHQFPHLSRYLISTAVTSLIATLFTAPVVLCWFGTFSPISPVINIVAVPLFGLGCIGIGALGFLLFFFYVPGAALILRLAAAATDNFLSFLCWTDDLAGDSVVGYLEVRPNTAYELAAGALALAAAAVIVESKAGVQNLTSNRVESSP